MFEWGSAHSPKLQQGFVQKLLVANATGHDFRGDFSSAQMDRGQSTSFFAATVALHASARFNASTLAITDPDNVPPK